ncbi:FxDxF family PEP-CTERM protein [Massilia sp. METH4]|uniref:FxDxF family PEP-CTERM protein n=1 Tax=Massilia sp. METH4 TaxID=3123041 RepID=UPI0030CB0EDE
MKKALFNKVAGSLLLTAGLLASGAASAQTTLTFNADGNADFSGAHAWSEEANLDTYLFDVDTTSWASGTAVVGRTAIDGVRMDAYAITGIQFFWQAEDGTRTNLETVFTTEGGIEFYPVEALVAGSYGFTVTGNTPLASTGGIYSGTLNLAPVPEPSTFAMLGVGIGLLALTARRKTDNKLG